MTQVTRTAEEVKDRVVKIRAMVEWAKVSEVDKEITDFESWLTYKEPTIEDLRKERPWKDIDVGEFVRYWTHDNEESTRWIEFTESLSPLGLEFARIVQYLNQQNPDTCGWFAFLDIGCNIHYRENKYEDFFITHRLFYAKDEQTIRRAVEIFTPKQYKKMLGIR